MIRTGWLIFKTAIPIFASRNMQQHELLNAIDIISIIDTSIMDMVIEYY